MLKFKPHLSVLFFSQQPGSAEGEANQTKTVHRAEVKKTHSEPFSTVNMQLQQTALRHQVGLQSRVDDLQSELQSRSALSFFLLSRRCQ